MAVTPTQEIHLQTRFTVGELSDGFQAYLRSARWPFGWMYLTAAGCLLVAAVIQLNGPWKSLHPAALVFAGAAALLALLRKMLRGSFQQSLEGHPHLDQPIQWKLRPSGFSLQVAGDHVDMTWPQLRRLICDRQGFLLFPEKQQFFWLPRSAFTNGEDLSRVEAWIKAARSFGSPRPLDGS